MLETILRETIEVRGLLVSRIRDYSLAQVVLWRQIPLLALKADGRTGYSSLYQLAYTQSLWRLPVRIHGFNAGFIDLHNGEILSGFDLSKRADSDVVLIIASHLEMLNAEQIVLSLKREARRPHGPYYDWKKQRRERNQNKLAFLRRQYSFYL